MICNRYGHQSTVPLPAIVAGMITRLKPVKRRLFLKENRKAKRVSATVMGQKLGIERESVHRLERETWRMDPEKQANYALALGLEPEELWSPPGTISLDNIVRSSPDELKRMAADIVRRLIESE